jgi:DNA-binding transcriptional regulator YiaG
MSLQEMNDVIDSSRLDPGDKERLKRLMALVSKSSREMDNFELRLAREAAGLTVRQAANLLNLSPQQLADLEVDGWIPMAEGETSPLADAFDEAYGLCREV